MTSEAFMLIVFQRQLFGSYPQLACRGWLLELAGSPHRPRPTRFRIRPNLTLTYPRNRDREHHSFEFRTTTLFRFDR